MDVSQVCHANGCGFTSHLGTLRFRNSDWLQVLIRGASLGLALG